MIFVWIPKTGGTTFVRISDMQVIVDLDKEWSIEKQKVTFGHHCPRALFKAGVLTSRIWANNDIVSIVRNPLDRFLSLFHDYKRSGRISHEMTQHEFIQAIVEMDPKPGLYNSRHLSLCAPQIDWLLPCMHVLRFEQEIEGRPLTLNSGGHNGVVDDAARPVVIDFYRADFEFLGYDTT